VACGHNAIVSHDDMLREMRRRLWGARSGVLLANDHALEVRVVIDPARGEPVFAARPAVVEAESVTLFTPDEGEGALQLLGEPGRVAGGHALTARWEAYYGTGEVGAWYRLQVEGVRLRGDVAEGVEVVAPSAVAGVERELCKALNADTPALARAVFVRAGERVTNPAALGLDPWGIDVRGKFGVIRLEFDEEARTEDDARRLVAALLAGAGA
jgi:hypothetical protein